MSGRLFQASWRTCHSFPVDLGCLTVFCFLMKSQTHWHDVEIRAVVEKSKRCSLLASFHWLLENVTKDNSQGLKKRWLWCLENPPWECSMFLSLKIVLYDPGYILGVSVLLQKSASVMVLHYSENFCTVLSKTFAQYCISEHPRFVNVHPHSKCTISTNQQQTFFFL